MKYFFTILISLFLAHTALAVDTVPSKKPVLPPPYMTEENAAKTEQHYSGTIDDVVPAPSPEPITDDKQAVTDEPPGGASQSGDAAGQASGPLAIIVGLVILAAAGIGFWFLKRRS